MTGFLNRMISRQLLDKMGFTVAINMLKFGPHTGFPEQDDPWGVHAAGAGGAGPSDLH
jgi:hypothetical protein